MKRSSWLFLACCLINLSSCEWFYDTPLAFWLGLGEGHRCISVIIPPEYDNYTVGEIIVDYKTAPDYLFCIHQADYNTQDTVFLYYPYAMSSLICLEEMNENESLELLIIDKNQSDLKWYLSREDAKQDKSVIRILQLSLDDLIACDFTITINEDLLLIPSESF